MVACRALGGSGQIAGVERIALGDSNLELSHVLVREE